MQRRHVEALLILLLMVGAGRAFAASLPGPQETRNQAFISQLSQPAPVQVCATSVSVQPETARVSCVTAYCQKIGDCSTCPGGLSAWYCDLDVHRCVPF
jgi:hypothetical protein